MKPKYHKTTDFRSDDSEPTKQLAFTGQDFDLVFLYITYVKKFTKTRHQQKHDFVIVLV